MLSYSAEREPLRYNDGMRKLCFLILVLLLSGCAPRYYKGNLHTHSLWSDGADFPEMIAAWYKQHGYNFLAITEHDMLQEGEKWVDINAKDAGWPPRNESTRKALPVYAERFGKEWVQERREGERHLIRLRALGEYRDRFEQHGEFLFIMAEEITDKGGAHVNAFNLTSAILPRGGATTTERISNNLAAVAEQQQASRRPIIAVINHPNFLWALEAEEIALVPRARLFEVYNGHRMTNNEGDARHPSAEKFWDIMLTMRHERGLPPVYGVATDDAHEYRTYSDTISRPGRGWVMVRARELGPEALLAALSAGDFYASTGVTLESITSDDKRMRIRVAAEPGVTYTTTFIGTRVGSSNIGEVLAEVTGATAEYRFKGDERFVRAKIVSSRAQLDPIGGMRLGQQSAWVQPVIR